MRLPPSLEQYIEQQTNPSWERLLIKVAAVQFTTSLVTLSICPQFGISPLGFADGLRELFMLLGHHWCELLCGLFYALSFFVGLKIVFNPFESRKLTQKFWLFQILILIGSSGFLLMWGLSLSLYPQELIEVVHSWWIAGYFLSYVISSIYQKISQPRARLIYT